MQPLWFYHPSRAGLLSPLMSSLPGHSCSSQLPGRTGRFRGRSALGAGCLPAFVHMGDPQSSFPRRHTCAALSDSWLLLPAHARHQEPLFSTALLYSCRSWSNLVELGSSLGAQTSGSSLNFSLPHFSHPMKGDTSSASLLGFLWELGKTLSDVLGGIANARQAREARASLCVRLVYQTVNRFEAENTPFPPRPKRSASHQPCKWQLSAKGECEFNFHPGVSASQLLMGRGEKSWGWCRDSFPGETKEITVIYSTSPSLTGCLLIECLPFAWGFGCGKQDSGGLTPPSPYGLLRESRRKHPDIG